MWNLKVNATNELNLQNTLTNLENERMVAEGRMGEGIVREFGLDMYTLLCLEWITNMDLLGEDFGGERIHVYEWLNPLALHLKTSEHCLLIGYTPMRKGASQVMLVVKNLPANAGDLRDAGSIPGSGRFSGGGHSNPLQYSCLENLIDRGGWRATVHSVTRSQTRLK